MSTLEERKTDWNDMSRKIRESLNRIIERNDFILGEDVQSFEAEAASYLESEISNPK